MRDQRPGCRLSPLSENQQLPQKQEATSSRLSWFKTALKRMVRTPLLLVSRGEEGPLERLSLLPPPHPSPPSREFKGETTQAARGLSSFGSRHPLLPTLGYSCVVGQPLPLAGLEIVINFKRILCCQHISQAVLISSTISHFYGICLMPAFLSQGLYWLSA